MGGRSEEGNKVGNYRLFAAVVLVLHMLSLCNYYYCLLINSQKCSSVDDILCAVSAFKKYFY